MSKVAFSWRISGHEEEEQGLDVKLVQCREPAVWLNFASLAGAEKASWWGGGGVCSIFGIREIKNK